MANLKYEVSNDVSVARAEMKLEVVATPISEVRS